MIDIDALLQAISPEAPCGDDLEYDLAFGELERATQGRPEQQIGATIVPAVEPEWADVRRKAIALFARTKDLRIAVFLIRALIHTEGWAGFRDGLSLARRLLAENWEHVHPQLDPDDDNDPELRINTITTLCDTDATLEGLRRALLVESRAVGRFSFRDVQIATGELTVPKEDDKPHPELRVIKAAFQAAEIEQLQQTAGAVDQSAELIAGIEAVLLERVGVDAAPDMSPLKDLIGAVHKNLAHFLSERDDMQPAAEPESTASADASATGEPTAAASGAGAARAAPGAINGRDDVIRTLDLICQYYDRHEPSSPVPLLLRRAQRLVSMDFLEILRDLAPDGLTQAEVVRGPETDG